MHLINKKANSFSTLQTLSKKAPKIEQLMIIILIFVQKG